MIFDVIQLWYQFLQNQFIIMIVLVVLFLISFSIIFYINYRTNRERDKMLINSVNNLLSIIKKR
jgi:Mg2+/citrate symporter